MHRRCARVLARKEQARACVIYVFSILGVLLVMVGNLTLFIQLVNALVALLSRLAQMAVDGLAKAISG